MEDYIKQMQDYLNRNSSKNDNNNILENVDNNENNISQDEDPELNPEKDQLYDCFQQIINNSNNDKKIQENKKIQNYDDKPLPALKNKTNNIENMPISPKNNIDDMPIKGNSNLNFNELLEKELSKEQNEGNYNNINSAPTKPKFKYIPKKKVDLVSAPGITKKYKYYSDNFKPRNRGHSVNITKKVNKNKNNDIIENNDEEIQNNSDDFDNYNKNNNQTKKKRVAPVMPENFKNSKFNRGRGYTGPLKNEKEDIQDKKIDNNKMNIDEKNSKSLWGELNNNYEQKNEKEDDLEGFKDNEEDDDEIKMNTNLVNNIFGKNNNNNSNNNNKMLYNNININNFNNDEDKEELPLEEKEPIQEKLENKENEDFGVINEEYIKNLMNYDVHDVEDILNLNNKINSGNDSLYNNNVDINNHEIYKNNFNNDIVKKNNIEQEEENNLNSNNINLNKYQIGEDNENINENVKKEEEKELEEDDEDNREIYKMFEDKLYQNEPIANNIKPQQIKINKDKDKPIPLNSIKNQQSRLMNKYFGNALNNNQNKNNTGIGPKKNNKQKNNQNNKNINNNQKQKNNQNNNNIVNNDSNTQIKDLVNEKITELNKIIEKLKKDNIKVIDLKKEYERLSKKYKSEVEEYNKKRENDRIEFEKMKEEEKK